MEQHTSTLLPYILDLLSRYPQLSTSKDDLLDQIQQSVLDEHIAPFGTLERAVEFALEVGSNLGIITVTNEKIRTPFNFRKRRSEINPSASRRICAAEGRKLIRERMPKAKAKMLAKAKAAKRKTKPASSDGRKKSG
ncbi:hypothetical protein KR009_010058, partial [Drosophila setifemur]